MPAGRDTALWVQGPQEIYLADSDGRVVVYDGSRWQRMHIGFGHYLNALWGDGDSQLLAVGQRGAILHRGL